jgi:predicted acylesterase/phospholipase RssA
LDAVLQRLLPRRHAVPPAFTEQAVIPGIANARYWMDRDLAPFIQSVIEDNQRENAAFADAGKQIDAFPLNLLAISGGSEVGAFSAGLLTGWSAHGTRPQFRVVTGISAGALVAPFAFLGPEYDDVIRHIATSIGPNDVFRPRSLLVRLASDGLADSTPLARLIATHVTPKLLAAIATEYGKGRVLQIGTTDLDAGRPVTWNMGGIASSAAPGALDLFRKVMVASMSIPGSVSPVMIGVEVDGMPYQEMHVDGGVLAQVFTYPPRTVEELNRATGTPFRRERNVYVIRNGKLQTDWSETKRRTLDIGSRAISALIQSQGINDLDRIFHATQMDGANFYLAHVGANFNHPHDQKFDNEYMRRLFDYAYQLGANGYPWLKAPPG